MLKFWHHYGILGINARNLLYIKPLNKKAQIQFADDKLRTKQYLSARGVNTARLLGKISSESDLLKFSWSSLPNTFVLKPNAGYGGDGIIIVTNREEGGWITAKGNFFSQKEMIEHVMDILGGRYSISGSQDSVFFEQHLVCHPEMARLGKYGLPDIRVIVYNLVPVMAMVRIPTQESHGKANMQLGGLGLGVDLAKGEITHMAFYNKIIKEHPDFGSLRGEKIPFWEEILLLATQIQQHITLGYLAVDIVIDADIGPALLEINARAGLKVQVANLAPLRDRLDRVAGVKVQSAEKGVRLAQDLYGNKIERSIQALSGKKVIAMEEEVTLNLKHGTATVLSRMNPSMNKNYIDETLFRKIAHDKSSERLTLGYSLQGNRGKTVFYPLEMSDAQHQMILGKNVLSGFFLDVSKTAKSPKMPNHKVTPVIQGTKSSEDYRHLIDNRLSELDKQLTLVSLLRPLNLIEEKKRFFASKDYEPQFRYKPFSADLLNIQSELQAFKLDLNQPICRLLDHKRQELLRKIALISVIGDDELFPKRSVELMGMPPKAYIVTAEKAFRKLKKPPRQVQTLSSAELVQEMQAFLKKRGLVSWKVKLKEGIVSRCVIGKNNRLFVRAGEKFSRWDIDKLIAHEIETHIYCTENGKLQPYQLFRRGAAHYLKTQEGLAVYTQSQVVEGGTSDALISFQAVLWARKMGFRKLYEALGALLDPARMWETAVKTKRGLSDTGCPGAFMKSALYYWGYLEIEDYLRSGGELRDLYLGKFELSHLDLIHQVTDLKKIRYLPRFLDD